MRAVRADALNLAGFEEAQQHDLHARAHLADFVEEDRAVRRRFEQAGFVAVRAREAAAHVPEELGFEERVRQSRAVERDERRGGARAPLMNQTRDDFLADSRLARDEDFGIRAGRALQISLERADHIAPADQTHFRVPCGSGQVGLSSVSGMQSSPRATFF